MSTILNDKLIIAASATEEYKDGLASRFVIRKTIGLSHDFVVARELLAYNNLIDCFTHYIYVEKTLYNYFPAAQDDLWRRVRIQNVSI